jgi:hypothetical protein
MDAGAVHHRIAALALDDEAQRGRRMAMGAGDLAGHDDLDIGDQGITG